MSQKNVPVLCCVDFFSAKLRDIVIDKKTPEFETTMSKGIIEKGESVKFQDFPGCHSLALSGHRSRMAFSDVLTFYHPMPRATEFSDRATTDRCWASGNTSRYKVQASMFSTVV